MGKKLVESGIRTSMNLSVLIVTNHDIDMDVAVSRMSEARNGKSAAGLESLGEVDKIDKFAPGNNDILVQLFQAGSLQGFRKRPPEIPQFFARFFIGRCLDIGRMVLAKEPRKCLRLSTNAARLAVQPERVTVLR